MTEEEFGTRFHGKDGAVVLFLRHDPPSIVIPDGVQADKAALEFVRIANEMLLPEKT